MKQSYASNILLVSCTGCRVCNMKLCGLQTLHRFKHFMDLIWYFVIYFRCGHCKYWCNWYWNQPVCYLETEFWLEQTWAPLFSSSVAISVNLWPDSYHIQFYMLVVKESCQDTPFWLNAAVMRALPYTFLIKLFTLTVAEFYI